MQSIMIRQIRKVKIKILKNKRIIKEKGLRWEGFLLSQGIIQLVAKALHGTKRNECLYFYRLYISCKYIILDL